jgi:hypothetical protein
MEEILGRMPLHLALPRTFEDNCVNRRTIPNSIVARKCQTIQEQ